MKASVFSRLLTPAVFTATLLSTLTAKATSGAWDGDASVYWTNNVNWANNAAYPVNDDTATFNGAGNNRTNIDLSASSPIAVKYITFDGTGAAAYNIGTWPFNSQTNIMRNDGNYQMTVSCKSSQALNQSIQLGTDKGGANYYFQNSHPANVLTVNGNLFGALSGGTAGDKTINFNGIGQIKCLGSITNGGANNLDINIYNTGTTTLSGTNMLRYLRLYGGAGSVLDIGAGLTVFTNSSSTGLGGDNFSTVYGGTIKGTGALVLTTGGGENYSDNRVEDIYSTLFINCRLTGSAGFEFYHGAGISGTFALGGINDFKGHVFMNTAGKISAAKFGNRGSTDSNLGAGMYVGFNSWNVGGPTLVYTGTGENTDRVLRFSTHGQLDQSGTGNINFTAPPLMASGSGVTITLLGSSLGTGEISGVISNGAGAAVSKSGTGTWTLSASNLFSSAISVNAGTLAFSGASGSALSASGISIAAAGTLTLNNTPSANHPNRIKDSGTVTMTGGALRFTHTGGAADYSENVGTVSLSSGANTIASSQAASGRMSTLTLTSLTRTSGTVNFVGAGLGSDSRNRIFIGGQGNGLIGPWALVNGTSLAAYDSVLGVYPAADAVHTDIAARGPSSTIPDNAAANVRINSDGVEGAIALENPTTTISSLLQNTATPAVVATDASTLKASAVIIPAGKAAVTIGANASEGTLSSASAGATLSLANSSTNSLTVNAVIADNTSASALSQSGAGKVKLAAANTFSGGTAVSEGTLLLAHSNALQNSTLTVGTVAPEFDGSVSGHAFTLGGLTGTATIPLADNAGNPLALTVGKNNGSTTYSGTMNGPGSLTKIGTGTFTLNGTNAFFGGLNIAAGKVVANHQSALGNGFVVNHGTLDLTVAPCTYSGLSTNLSGSGTVNASSYNGQYIGGYVTYLNGDYAGFTGTWNLGVNAQGIGSSKFTMNGRDNAAATIVVRTNSTLQCTTAMRHNATLILQGGSMGEANGQIRLDNNAEWAGPILLAAPVTNAAHGFVGSGGGVGYISGPISDAGNGFDFGKAGGNTIIVNGTNNTYTGTTWVKNGTLRGVSIKNVGQASSLGTPATVASGAIKIGYTTTGATLGYAGMGDTSDRIIDLAGTTGGATLEQAGSNVWALTGGMNISGTGNKTLTLSGSTIGVGEFSGVISNGLGSKITLAKSGTGTWRLTNANTFTGGVNVTGGKLVSAHPSALGAGEKQVSITGGTGSTVDFATDGAGETVYNLTINSSVTAPVLMSNRQTPGEGIDHHIGTLHVSTVTLFATNGENVVSGTPSLSADTVNLFAGASGTTILYPVNTDLALGTITISSNNFSKTLQLDGVSSGNTVNGPISNGLNTVAVIKAGTGSWTLYGSNVYSGSTAVNKGLLKVTGANGTIQNTSGITLATDGILEVFNSETTNHPNRLNNAAGITLNSGKLRYAHSGAASFSESAGTLTVGTSKGTIETDQAEEGYTSALTFTSLARTGAGSINFVGTGLGVDDRNTIRFSTPPTLSNGIIGPWAMYNGASLASYDLVGTLGVIPAPAASYTNITALGPSVIPNNSSLNAQINDMGTEGPIALEGATSSSVNTLFQNTEWAATVGMTNQTLLTAGVIIGAGKASLTLGTAEGEGVLSPLTSGGNLQLANYSASPLTVNAAVSNNSAASTLTKSGAGAVRLNGSIVHTGGTVIGEGELIIGGATTQAIAHVISGKGALTKQGAGRVSLSNANTYDGVTTISGGILIVSNNAALGSTLAGTVIADGGTLDVGGSGTDQAVNLNAEQITVSGAGVNSRGAIINSSPRSQYNALRLLTLAGDATFGGELSTGRWDVRNTSGSAYFTMNGHTVTKVGTNTVGLTNTTVTDPGNIDVQQGVFTFEGSTVMNGSAANTLSVQAEGTFDIYEMVAPVMWSLAMNDKGRYYARQGAITRNFWAGPVTLNGSPIFDAYNGFYSTISGDISGSGSLTKIGQGTICLSSTNNSWAGTTTVTNGTLWAYHPATLPSWSTPGKVHLVYNGTLAVSAGDGTVGWTSDQISDLINITTVTNSSAAFTIDTTWAGATVSNLQKAVGLNVQGTNAVTLSGINTNSTGLTNNGYVRLYNGATLNVVAGSSNVVGRVVVQPGSLTGTLNLDGLTTLENLYVGNGNADRARVFISTNITMSRLYIGNNGIANGAVVQNDGKVDIAPYTINTDVLSLGLNNAYGYYRLNRGSIRAGQLGFNSSNGSGNNGVFDQFGGETYVTGTNGWLLWGWTRGNSVANIFSGILSAPPGNNDATFSLYANNGCFSMLNMLGNGAFFDSTGYGGVRCINMAGAAGNLASVINLNAGTILANRVRSGAAGTPTYFNFNGGTLMANAGTTLGAIFMQGLTAATVYPGGAVIDTTNATLTLNQSLVAPAALGVGWITVFNPGAGYIGAPVVMISGGSGTGATAIASVDLNPASSTAGQVTGITVTSPGTGYLPGDTLVVSLIGGGYLSTAVAGVSLMVPNTSTGGLTKLGDGTLTLGGTNTYGGATTINAGTLSLAHRDALPTNAVVNVAGGTYDLGGATITNGSVTATGGAIANGALVSSDFDKTGSGTLMLCAPLASATPIRVESGTLSLSSYGRGLLEGAVWGSFVTISNNPSTAVQLTTRMANTTLGWPTNTTYMYNGYIWNRASTNVTWTFAENFDDNVYLKIDNTVMMTNGISWSTPTLSTITLIPGPHPFVACFGQGGGGAGPVDGRIAGQLSWWKTTAIAFGIDYFGRNETNVANYVAMTDPGDGSLLTRLLAVTNALAPESSVELASGAALDLGGSTQTLADLTGSGLVSNGTLTVTGIIAPGGENALGTMSVCATNLTLTGTLLVDVASDSCDTLAVTGNVDLSGLALVIANPESLNRSKKYTVLTHTGTRTGTFESLSAMDSRWHVMYQSDGSVVLMFVDGTLIKVR